MSVFDLDTEGATSIAEQARANHVSVSDVGPGFWEGIGPNVDQGVMRGGIKLADTALTTMDALDTRPVMSGYRGTNRLLPPVAQGVAIRTPEEIQAQQEAQAAWRRESIDYWTPNANEVGTAGRVLGGLSEMVLPLMVAGGHPAPLVGTTVVQSRKDLIEQGVDPDTATTVGLTEGLATAVGFKLPFLGKTLASKVATGAAGNLALGTVSTAVDRTVLESAGYEQQAQQFDPFSAEARTVDLLSGLAFGGVAHLAARPSVRDASLAANNAKHFQQDTAPGIPADTASSVIHQNAMESALRDLEEGVPVSAPEAVADATYLKRPEQPQATEVIRENIDVPEPHPESDFVIASDATLNAVDRAIETKFAEQLQRDPEAAMKAYAKLEDSGGGKMLNTDVARELSPDYLADRTKSAAVHEPASALVKMMYERKLAEAPKRGEKPVVLFSAGGTGAGKTTGIKTIGGIEDVQIVYDSNMNSFDSAVTRIDKALNAGKDVKILYTYRDPVEALTVGALTRAMGQEGKYGSGRTVPIAEHAKTHEGSAKVLHELAAKYKDNPRVDIMVVDNSKGKGKAVLTDISAVPKKGYDSLERKLNEALDTEYKAGRISESVYKGFKGEAESGVQKPSREQGAQPADSAGSPKESQRIVEPLAVEVAAADQALAVKDLQIPTGEIDADGTPRTMSAREMMAQAKQDVAQAKKESVMFEAAVTCFLTAGA